MPEKKTLQRARRAKRQGKKPTTQAGAFVEEEMRHAKSGKHPVKSRKQAIAIGLSKARRSGVKLPARKRSAGAGAAKRTTKTAARRSTAKRAPAKRRAPAPRRKTTSRAKGRARRRA